MNNKIFKLFILIMSLSLFAVNCSKNNPNDPNGGGTTPPPSGSKKADIKIKIEEGLMNKISYDIQSIRFNNQTFNIDSFIANQITENITIPDNGDYVYVKLKNGMELRSQNKFIPIENGSAIDENVFVVSSDGTMDYYDPNGIGKTISDTVYNFINNYGIIEFKNNTGFINIKNLIWETDQLISSTFGNAQTVKVFAKPATGRTIGIMVENTKNGTTSGDLKGPYDVTKGEVTVIELTVDTPAKSGAVDGTLYDLYN